MNIPAQRMLVQLRCKRAQLTEALQGSTLPSAELPTWVELFVETSDVHENLNEIVQEMVRDQPFRVIRVISEAVGNAPHLSDAILPSATIESLLENPVDVFDRLLEQVSDLSDAEVVAVRTAFAELRELELTSQEVDAAPHEPAQNAMPVDEGSELEAATVASKPGDAK